MAGWHPQLNGHDSEQTPGDGEELGGLVHCRRVGSQRAGDDVATEQRQQPKGHRLNAIGTALLQESDCPHKMSLVFQT